MGAAGYTGGELIRLLLCHPEVEIVFANSESNAGNKVYDVHEGLIGDTELEFTSDMPFNDVDVVFFCFGHGKSEAFLNQHTIPEGVKIIDLAQDFRIKGGHDYVYGLPEIHRDAIAQCQHLANPGCFATRRDRLDRGRTEAIGNNTLLMAQQQLLCLQALHTPASARDMPDPERVETSGRSSRSRHSRQWVR